MGWDTLAFIFLILMALGGLFTLLAMLAEFISNHF